MSEGNKEEYTKFINAKLKKYGVKSPAELSDEDKKILQELDTSLGMTRDSLNLPIPDVNESAFVAPSDKSIQRMIESFTDAQRIA